MILFREVIVAALLFFTALSCTASEDVSFNKLSEFVQETERDYQVPIVLTNGAEIDLLTSKHVSNLKLNFVDFGSYKVVTRQSENLPILFDLTNYNLGIISDKWKTQDTKHINKPVFIRGYTSDVLDVLDETCSIEINYKLKFDFNLTFFYSGDISMDEYCEGLIVALSMSGLKLYIEQEELNIRDRHYDLEKKFQEYKNLD